MEVILGAAVIIILLFILGFGFNVIAFGIAVVLSVMTALTTLAFIFVFVRLLLSKKCEGEFTKIARADKGKFDRAYYMTPAGELPNIFPCEFVMRDKLYKKGRKVRLRIDRNKKQVYDRNAVMTIVTGTIFGIMGFLAVLGIAFYLHLF